MDDRINLKGPSSYWECLERWRASKVTSARPQGAQIKRKRKILDSPRSGKAFTEA